MHDNVRLHIFTLYFAIDTIGLTRLPFDNEFVCGGVLNGKRKTSREKKDSCDKNDTLLGTKW